jgi:hypothetical protein
MFIKEVESSSIKTVAYDKDEEKLWLRFKSDALYEYTGVEQQVAKDLVKAESKGHFFHENIKNKYPYAKVEEEE